MKKIILACILTLGTNVGAFSQAPIPSAPTNPLQQRVITPAPAASTPIAPAPIAPTTAKMPMAETKAMDAKPAPKNAGAARRKQCSEEYQASKKANTLAGQTWPKFYSACNKRLKGV